MAIRQRRLIEEGKQREKKTCINSINLYIIIQNENERAHSIQISKGKKQIKGIKRMGQNRGPDNKAQKKCKM